MPNFDNFSDAKASFFITLSLAIFNCKNKKITEYNLNKCQKTDKSPQSGIFKHTITIELFQILTKANAYDRCNAFINRRHFSHFQLTFFCYVWGAGKKKNLFLFNIHDRLCQYTKIVLISLH